jgi:transposase-like protein
MNPNCPHCQSTNTSKNGFNPSGIQRYKCGTCKRRFAELIRPRGRPVTGTAKTSAERKRLSRLNQKLKVSDPNPDPLPQIE